MSTLETTPTICPMNCHPTQCGMCVEVQGRQLLSIKGGPDNPDSQGFLCMRGQAALGISHVTYPTHVFHTPSGKIEFYSGQAREAELPALPVHEAAAPSEREYPLALCHGRTLTALHSFYDHGRALPLLAERNSGPELWLSEADARALELGDGDAIRVYNERGSFDAHVTGRINAVVVWIRDGTVGLNRVTSGAPVLPESALGMLPFSVRQTNYGALVDLAPA